MLELISVDKRLLDILAERKFSFFGHLCRHQGLDNDLLLGSMYGTRPRGRPKTRYSDNIRQLCENKPIAELQRMAQDRTFWRRYVKGHGRSFNDQPVL